MKNRPINYYYYYYGGYYDNNKSNDIENLIKFLVDSSEMIFKLVDNDSLSKGFFKDIDENNYKELDLKGWLTDVKSQTLNKIRDLKMIIYINDTKSIDKLWKKLDVVGLTGIQLKSKLSFWYSKFVKLKTIINDGFNEINDNLIKVLKEFLKATNVLLKSAIAVSKLIGFDTLIELKDLFEITLD